MSLISLALLWFFKAIFGWIVVTISIIILCTPAMVLDCYDQRYRGWIFARISQAGLMLCFYALAWVAFFTIPALFAPPGSTNAAADYILQRVDTWCPIFLLALFTSWAIQLVSIMLAPPNLRGKILTFDA